jgi:hypothetical protein
VQIKTRIHHGQTYVVYEARPEACNACPHRARCLKPEEAARRVERVREGDAMKAYLARQQQPDIQQLYKTRKAVAEFPQLRFKGQLGLSAILGARPGEGEPGSDLGCPCLQRFAMVPAALDPAARGQLAVA